LSYAGANSNRETSKYTEVVLSCKSDFEVCPRFTHVNRSPPTMTVESDPGFGPLGKRSPRAGCAGVAASGSTGMRGCGSVRIDRVARSRAGKIARAASNFPAIFTQRFFRMPRLTSQQASATSRRCHARNVTPRFPAA